jgi:putative SOS response-associated peptidase YedK
MCNRFKASFEFRETKIRWNIFNDLIDFKPIHNIAPGRRDGDILAIRRSDQGNEARLMYWPLIPAFAKGMKPSFSTMNARVERLTESPIYNRLLQQRRCIIPMQGFYEWTGAKSHKQPWFVYLKSREPFALAGLWDSWRKPDGSILESFTIITLPPNDFIRPLHDRIPAILHRDEEEPWLNCSNSFEKVRGILEPFPSELMATHQTSTRMNDPRYNEPNCADPIEPQQATLFG